jgi:DNA-directed RNA polymerase specialized sigma subunit
MKNPLESYTEEREKRAAEQRAQDTELWHQWKQDPTPNTLEPLLKRFDNVIGQRVSMWKAPNVSESALRANLHGLAIKAFETYDPNKAALNTHLQNTLRRGLRFTRKNQNLAYIPEAKVERIGPIDRAVDELTEELGRPPSPAEISSHMNQSLPQGKRLTSGKVQEIQGQRRSDLFESGSEFDPVSFSSPREQEVLSLLRPSLSQDHQQVFDHLYGLNGKARITSTGEIAQRLGKSPSQVSRVKKHIEGLYRRYA